MTQSKEVGISARFEGLKRLLGVEKWALIIFRLRVPLLSTFESTKQPPSFTRFTRERA